MITANQLRAARALLSIDQRQMAELADLSVPTIQRMEASDGVIRANVDSLMKLVSALESAGIELINPGAASAAGGRGVRLREYVANPKPNLKTKAKTVRQPKRVLERVR
jgi:transcriptional regulator with XRE-family HTH domain